MNSSRLPAVRGVPSAKEKTVARPRRPVDIDETLLLFWFVLAWGLIVLMSCVPVPKLGARFVDDDAAYYLQIARQLANRHGSTFDGLHLTNGYHPLWLLCLVPLQWLAAGAPEVAFRLSLALCVALGWGSLFVLARIGRCCRVPPVATAAGLALLGEGLLISGSYGMEMFLLVALGALTIGFIAGVVRVPSPPRRACILGFLLGLAILARLDSIFLLAAVLCAGILEPRHWLRLLGAVALLVAPYLAWNWLTFGHLMPISGALKSSFPHLAQASLPCWRHLSVPCMAVIYMLAPLARSALGARHSAEDLFSPSAERRAPSASLASAARCLALYTLFHFAYSMLFMRWGVKDWHFALYPLAAAVMLMDEVAALPCAVRGAQCAVRAGARSLGEQLACVFAGPRTAHCAPRTALLLCLLLAALMARKLVRQQDDFNAAAYETARWARAHLPEDAVFVMKDAGFFGYFSERRTINADGLVNDYTFQQRLRRGELARYLCENRVRYLVQQVPADRGDVLAGAYDCWPWRNYSQLYGVYSDPIFLCRKQEVYRSPFYRSGSIRSRFIIWKL